MFFLPVVILALSGISGAGGVALSAKSVVDSLEASSTNRYVQERNERNLLRFEACSDQLEKAIYSFGKQRVTISKNFNVFINAFEKIHNRPEFSQVPYSALLWPAALRLRWRRWERLPPALHLPT